MPRSYYTVLQVNPSATPEEIKEAYRSLAWKVQSEGDQEALKEVSAAYSVLSNPERRAEYDRQLASGEPAAAVQPAPSPAPVAAAPAPQRPEIPAEGPGFHPFLWLFGELCEFSYYISRLRYWFIPVNLILGIAALVGCIVTANSYVNAPRLQVPFKTTVHDVVHELDHHKYLSVTGNLDRDPAYKVSDNGSVIHYYILVSGPDVLIVRGRNLPTGDTFSGRLQPFANDLAELVKDDAQDPQLPKGMTIGTRNFLDVDYTPTKPGTYLTWAWLTGFAAFVLLIPPLFRFAVFLPRRGQTAHAADGGPQWPVQVTVSGKFTADNGKRSLEHHVPALLGTTGNPDHPLEARFARRFGRSLMNYGLAIPAESVVQWGYEYGGGKARPTVLFRKGGWWARVSVPTEADAKWLADRFTTGGQLS